MQTSKPILKRGSCASRIWTLHNTYIKEHILSSPSEALAIQRGIELLYQYHPGSVQRPISLETSEVMIGTAQCIKIAYQQPRIEPWIKESWITAAHLYDLAELVLQLQRLMIKNGLAMIDARPSNFALASYPGKLVDLASIKPCSKRVMASFNEDFLSHFIRPLLAEKRLDIPVALYSEGNLDGHIVGGLSPWVGLTINPKVFASLAKNNILRAVNEAISSSNPKFIRFICAENCQSLQELDLEPAIYARKALRLNAELLKAVRPTGKGVSHWLSYSSFHDVDYTTRKLRQIQIFAKVNSPKTMVVDLGSNTTSQSIREISVRIDRDRVTANRLRMECAKEQIILNLDIAKALCSDSRTQLLALNCQGLARAAVVTGLIHHLVIDEGLHPEGIYEVFSSLYDDILLEFPAIDDPMVQLLAKKKGEALSWAWEDHERYIRASGFRISSLDHISSTRFIAVLTK